MKFDPITGEPINDESETQTEQEMRFDPMTGEPVTKADDAKAKPEFQFDPMTGEPVTKADGAEAKPEFQFDPMTGEPVTKADGAKTKPEFQFDPMTGKPVTKKPETKSKLPKILGIAAVSVAIAAVLVTVLVNAFTPASAKVTAAVGNTFTDMPYIARELKSLPLILTSDKIAAGISGEIEDNTVSLEFMRSGNNYQAVLGINGDDIKDFKAAAGFDSEKLSFYVPQIDKRVFIYNYKKNNSGYLDEMLSLDEFNDFLKSLGKSDDIMKDFTKDMAAAAIKELKNAKFEKIDSKNFKINDKDVKCDGYKLKIDDKLVKSILKSMQSKIDKKYKDKINDYLELYYDEYDREYGYDYDVDELFEEILDEIDDMEDITIRFYIKGNKLAAVIMESDETEISIEFRGGDYRTQNMVLNCDYGYFEQILKVKGSVSNNVEKIKVTYEDSIGGKSDHEITVEYDYKKGDFEIEFGDDISIEGKLKASSSEIKADIDKIKIESLRYSKPISIYINKKPDMVKMNGKEFDLGNADEDEWEDLLDDLEDSIEDLDLDDLIYAVDTWF